MPAPGHRPVSSDEPQRETRRVLEATVVPPSNRVSVSYYKPIEPPRRFVNESAVLGEDWDDLNAGLPDVAIASFGEPRLLEAVIGTDDRVKVAKSLLSNNPWRQICALRIRSQSNQLYVGTGWFIGPKTIATAGHCVFLQDDGGWAQSIDVIPAKFGSSTPFGKLTSTRFWAVDGWTVESSRDFDYGVITLDNGAVGVQIGNFEVRSFADPEFANVVLKISGYPADREQANFQYFHERPIQRVTTTRLFYDVDTFGGQSGSPIWQDTEENGVVAVGIHTNGGVTSNSGTRISDDVIDNFISWLEA
ncbi:MAG: trypsin-like peptidase domain-containing protein [Pyrinomonadaceae bacterium]